ncbi:hypothetical protein RRG08_022781 [Elysia crispata]|uniref:CCHC-type domain-containing protein n=1 Tax=Elysia crispata TaxID=231223 RepID=A0AAE1B274_9GAST|nr:hypothetical protein RRG08_022781 [Elysia crispata]
MSNPQVSFHDLRKTVLRSRPEDSQNNERASNNMVHRQQALQTAPENSIHVVNMMKEFFNRQELREEALATSLRETLNQVSSLTKTVELQQKQREVERHNRQSGADSGDVSGNRQRRRCFACRELGHFAAACRRSHRYQHYQRDSPQSSSSQRQQQQRRAADNQYPDCFHRHEHQWSRDGRYGQRPASIVCYFCRTPGHLERTYRYKERLEMVSPAGAMQNQGQQQHVSEAR